MSRAAFGFGADAHRIVGNVADQYLCADARVALIELVPDYSLAEAGVWADRIRADRSWDFAKPWHFINVPDKVPLSVAPRRSEGDVLSAIDKYSVQLADPSLSAAQRRVALLFLVHFVADVHQPLHVGRREDLGGNKVAVRVNGRNISLHSYWDSGVLEPAPRAAPQLAPADYAARLVAAESSAVATWGQLEPLLWATESQALRPEIYAFGPPDATGRFTLDAAYQARARQITDLRMTQAGVRLAGMLNAIWCAAAGAD